ncbi:MAG: hypothetical protein RKO24_07170 [Candidatus Competibacter sp.]|nr:hypothetical protein [Candidatus Competibacter sp.]
MAARPGFVGTVVEIPSEPEGANIMSKGADIKKETKKKPTKTLKEKKAEKKSKKENKGSLS